MPLSFAVTSSVDFPDVEITVEIPSTFEFVEVPAGTQIAGALSPGGAGPVRKASLRAPFSAMQTARYQTLVRPLAIGPAEIAVKAAAAVEGGVEAGGDWVFFTVGATPAESRFGGEVPDPAPVIESTGEAVPRDLPGRQPKTAPLTEVASAPEAPVATAAQACVTGRWRYTDNTGTLRNSVNFQVQAWDRDFGGDEFLASGVTDSNGNFSVCFENTDCCWPFNTGTVDIFIVFVSENSLWKVQSGVGNAYTFRFDGPDDIPNTGHNFGNLQPAQNNLMRALHAFDAINDLYFWVPGSCWDETGGCDRIIINWGPTSTTGTYYDNTNDQIYLKAADPDAPILVVHEAGHAVMDDVYEDAYPSTPNCNPHYMRSASSTGCAWTEGWATWLPLMVYNDQHFRWPDGTTVDLENHTWGTADWGDGDTVEGRVAGALIDVSDYTNEAYWDRYGEGAPGNIWRTFQANVSNTLSEFWTQRQAGSYNVAHSGARASFYQNTIDYSFRDPLSDYVELTRPMPHSGGHNYSYNTTTARWSVVAMRPVSGDFDLEVYDDFAQTVLLSRSAAGGTTIDFIAVDSNQRPLGDYYPRVYRYSGEGNYQIELAQGVASLALNSSASITMGAADVAAVRDIDIPAGTQVTFRAAPSSGTQDAEIYLMGPSASVLARSNALWSASGAGPGGTEEFTYLVSVGGRYGLVLLNRAGSGTYTLSATTGLPDLVVDSIVTNPVTPAPGQTVNVTVTIRNQGTGPANGLFAVDFYRHRTGPFASPPPALAGDIRCWILYASGMPPGGTTTCTGTVTYSTPGVYNMWAQVDTDLHIAESNEDNNIRGPQAITVAGQADLAFFMLVIGANPIRAGISVPVTITVKNQGSGDAGGFWVDFYKSRSGAPGPFEAGDFFCHIGSLAAGATANCSGDVTWPNPGPYNAWIQIDTDQDVVESNEANNIWGPEPVYVKVTNDDFAHALTAASLPYTDARSTSLATGEVSEPQPCGNIFNTVWYRYTPAANTTLVADTIGSSFDTVLAAYTGSDLTSLASVACSDDIDPLNLRSRVVFTAYAGVTYSFQAGGFLGATGNLVFNLAVLDTDGDGIGDTLDDCPFQPEDFDGVRDDDGCPEEDNDFFLDAWTISALPFVNTQGTAWAYLEPGEPRPCGSIGSTVWYVFTPTVNTSLIVNTAGSNFDTVLAVYSGTQLGSLNLLGCDDDSGGDGTSWLYLDLPAGQSYHFQVGGYNGATGILVLNLMASDMDGDGIGDGFDNCPYWYNPAQALPPWPVPADDWDCDGWSNDDEGAIGTNPLLACGPVAWPPDFNDDGLVDTQDVLALGAPAFFKFRGQPGYSERLDIMPDGVIDTQDVLKLGAPIFFKFCAP